MSASSVNTVSSEVPVTDSMIVAGLQEGRKRGISVADVHDVVHTHDQMGALNYIWLAPWLGSQPLWIEFREPPGPKSQWRHYNRYWWARHGCAVFHDPSRLVEDHVRSFVDPKTRFIELRFYFSTPSGFQYSASPTREFYEWEKLFFERHGLCSGGWTRSKIRQLAKSLRAEPKLAPHWGPEVLLRPVLEPPMPTPEQAHKAA